MQISGRRPALVGADQKAIDQIRLEIRLGRAADDQQLIDVGDDDLLPAAAGAAEHAVRGSTRSMMPFVVGRGRNSTKSPAATTCRWSVLSVLSSRRVAQVNVSPSAASTVLVSPCTLSTRPRRTVVSSTSEHQAEAGLFAFGRQAPTRCVCGSARPCR